MTRTQKSLLAAVWLVPLIAFPTAEVGGAVPGFGLTQNGLFSPVVVTFTWRSAAPARLFVWYRGNDSMNIFWRYWLTWIAGAVALTVYLRTQKGRKIPPRFMKAFLQQHAFKLFLAVIVTITAVMLWRWMDAKMETERMIQWKLEGERPLGRGERRPVNLYR